MPRPSFDLPLENPASLRFRDRLTSGVPLLAAELRPPRRDLVGVHAMDAWIDVYQAVRRLSTTDSAIFLTDNAIGSAEEENLGHLVRNLGADARRDRVVPMLTLKHPLPYCERFAARAREFGFPAVVCLGGDRQDGIPRCLDHAWQLRAIFRERQPGLMLGGWVNPYRDREQQVSFLLEHESSIDFVLTQIVSHHDLAPVALFFEEARRRSLRIPLLAGVFFYRSARRATLDALAPFIPVPREALIEDFRVRRMSPVEIAAATIRALLDVGFTRFYVSNLDTARAAAQLSGIAASAGLTDPCTTIGGARPTGRRP